MLKIRESKLRNLLPVLFVPLLLPFYVDMFTTVVRCIEDSVEGGGVNIAYKWHASATGSLRCLLYGLFTLHGTDTGNWYTTIVDNGSWLLSLSQPL